MDPVENAKSMENGLICPLHKKGDILKCDNYRDITLLNTGYKVLPNIICDRIYPYLEKIINNYQSVRFHEGKVHGRPDVCNTTNIRENS